MKLQSIALGVAVFAATAVAHAGTFGVSLNQTAPGFWSADYDSDFIVGSLLGGAPMVPGMDTVVFQDLLNPLAPGLYDVELTFHELTNSGIPFGNPITVTSADINGVPWTFSSKRTFTVVGTTIPPFYLHVNGFTNTADAGYHGTITVTAVPEPESYAMLLAGLGVMGAIARRRGIKKSANEA